MKSKKGAFGLPGPLVDFIGYSVFMLVIVVFFFLFKASVGVGGAKIVEDQFNSVDGDQFLTQYLKSSIELNGEKMTMADAIGISYDRGSGDFIKEIIKKDLVTILGKSRSCVGIRVLDEAGKTFVYPSGSSEGIDELCRNTITLSKITLLTRSERRITVELRDASREAENVFS